MTEGEKRYEALESSLSMGMKRSRWGDRTLARWEKRCVGSLDWLRICKRG